MFGGLGATELLLIFLVALLVFGARRLPEIGSSLGKGIREFKGSLREIENELKVPDDRREQDRQVRRPEPQDTADSRPRRLTAESGPPPAGSQAGTAAGTPGEAEREEKA